jgi:hypothetical protein
MHKGLHKTTKALGCNENGRLESKHVAVTVLPYLLFKQQIKLCQHTRFLLNGHKLHPGRSDNFTACTKFLPGNQPHQSWV